jgi:iron(III) transport system permease protein
VKIWTLLLWAVAAAMALPVLVTLGFLVIPSGEVWSHLADTVLPGYIFNSLALMVWVGAGIILVILLSLMISRSRPGQQSNFAGPS